MAWVFLIHGEEVEEFETWSACIHAAVESAGGHWDGISTPRLPHGFNVALRRR